MSFQTRFTAFLGSWLQSFRKATSWLWCCEAKFRGAQLPGCVTFIGRPILSVAEGSQLMLHEGVQVVSSLRANPLGCFQPSVLRTLTAEARLVLQKNVGISGSVICAGKSIEIGEGTIIGSGAMIIDNDFHFLGADSQWKTDFSRNAKPIKIGRGVFVGARAIILKGVAVGDYAVIGAGAVVTNNVPAGSVMCGNLAHTMKSAKNLDQDASGQ